MLFVAALNFAWFGVEFTAALRIDSVSLLADSIDFLEDTSVNLLIALALGWTAVARARLGFVLTALMVVPTVAVLWTLWEKYQSPAVPDPLVLTWVGIGALAINLTCTFLLVRFKAAGGSLTRAAFLSARNDTLANLGIIAVGLFTMAVPSVWPDVLLGFILIFLNLNAASEVWEAARREQSP